MNQPELFATFDDFRVLRLRNNLKQTEFWTPNTIDKLEKTSRMYRVLTGTVVKCFEEVKSYERSINSKSYERESTPKCGLSIAV